MTPKESAERLRRIFEEGGEEAFGEALSELASTDPVECIETIEAIHIIEGDDEGLEVFQADLSRGIRRAIEDQLTQDGFAFFDKLIRLARENGMDDTADKFAAYSQRFRN